MSQPRVVASPEDMISYATDGQTILEGHSRADLEQRNALGLAIVRVLEIVGEAATRIPQDVRERYPEIP